MKGIEDKLNQIARDVADIRDSQHINEVTSAEQHMTLQEHTRRRKASEARIGVVEALAEKTWNRLEGHFKFLKGSVWAISVLCGGLAVLWTGIQIYLAIRGIK